MKNQTKIRDSFIFYRSFFNASKHLKVDEKAALFDAICECALNNKKINLSGMAQGMFELIKPQLEANRKKFENGCKKKKVKVDNKLLHSEAKDKQNEAKDKQTISKTEGNVNVNDNVNEECKLELELELESKRVIPPTLQEVKDYCIERKNNVNPAKFIDFYESKGWVIGKVKMKSWKAAVRTWENNNKNESSTFDKSKWDHYAG